MKQSDNDIKDMFQNVLEQHSTTVQFESIWGSKSGNNSRKSGFKKIAITPLVAVITLIVLCTVGFASYSVIRNVDKIDYTFNNDSRVIGKWDTVDFVQKIESFDPEKKSWTGPGYLTSMVFIKEGKMLISTENNNLAYTPSTWTKNIILNGQEKTASKYKIKKIKGTTYMFFEWKSGDYVFRNMTPYYYVLKKVDSKDYSNYQVHAVKEDNVDYPFVDDAQLKGKWESVDFVSTIGSYIPGQKSWIDALYLTELVFDQNGALTIGTLGGRHSSDSVTWTKGLVLNKYDKTASKCEIKEINGSTYMFFEWKSGDYIFRNMTPYYYVLKKVE